MLVLSRQKDESIMIGDDVEITIVDVRGDKVRLGIVAPREVPVHRREVYEAIQRENEEKKQKQEEEGKE
jgi:carbon storage regulator